MGRLLVTSHQELLMSFYPQRALSGDGVNSVSLCDITPRTHEDHSCDREEPTRTDQLMVKMLDSLFNPKLQSRRLLLEPV